MKCLVVGGSISAGYGLALERLDSSLWANKFLKTIKNYDLEDIENISSPGDDNFEIFKKTFSKLKKATYNTVIVCWQATHRKNYCFGLETYDTRFSLVYPEASYDINLVNDTKVSKDQLLKMQKNFISLYNYHWDIKDLVFYVNALVHISMQKEIDIRFVNYNLPWDSHSFFNRIEFEAPSSLDPFTNEILQSDYRDDSQIKEIYKLIHDEYDDFGGIQENYWLNLYDPLRRKQIDIVLPNEPHPGYKSQEIFADFLTQSYNSCEPINTV